MPARKYKIGERCWGKVQCPLFVWCIGTITKVIDNNNYMFTPDYENVEYKINHFNLAIL